MILMGNVSLVDLIQLNLSEQFTKICCLATVVTNPRAGNTITFPPQ